jgi:hypothetical protein
VVDFDHDSARTGWWANAQGQPGVREGGLRLRRQVRHVGDYDPKTGKRIEVERDSDFDGKYDIKEVYDRFEALTAIRRDRNGDGNPDYWEQYKDGALVAILYDDDYDNKVDRKDEVPGSRPKFVAPEPERGDAAGSLDAPAAGSGAPAPAAGSGGKPK